MLGVVVNSSMPFCIRTIQKTWPYLGPAHKAAIRSKAY